MAKRKQQTEAPNETGAEELNPPLAPVPDAGVSEPDPIAADAPATKTLNVSDAETFQAAVSDIEFIGNVDIWQLLCEAQSDSEGWIKSTNAMSIPGGALVNVTTQQRNPDGSYSLAEALTFVPGVKVLNAADGRYLGRA